MSSSESQDAMRKAAEEGKTFIPKQQAEYAAQQAAEAARVAGLPPDQLPEGAFKTQAEAEAYLDQARANGKHPQAFEGGDYTIQIDSAYGNIWTTAVSDVPDSAFPDEK